MTPGVGWEIKFQHWDKQRKLFYYLLLSSHNIFGQKSLRNAKVHVTKLSETEH